jgi:hypothetical protein
MHRASLHKSNGAHPRSSGESQPRNWRANHILRSGLEERELAANGLNQQFARRVAQLRLASIRKTLLA